jgi:hypothetical protein
MQTTSYFAPVSIPPTEVLFKDLNKLLNFQSSGSYYTLDPSELSDVAFEFFKSMHVKPKFIAVFNSPYVQSNAAVADRIIHRDITLDESGQWKSIRCALNWELNPRTTSEWFWYDMSALPEFWPPDIPDNPIYQRLSGIHYGARRWRKGASPRAVLLQHARVSTPVLVRVDVPHTVAYQTPMRKESYSFAKNTKSHNRVSLCHGQRISVSMRFEETNWNSWEKCLHAFRSILTNQISD